MKCFLLQKFQKEERGQLLIRHKLLSISIILSLFSMPVCAQSSYLFPSDIIDQAEQSQYDIGRKSRYETNKQWVYPNDSQFKTKRAVYSDSNQQLRVNHNDIPYPSGSSYEHNQYQSSQYQSKNVQPYSNQVEPSRDWYGQSEHYKYGDFKTGQVQTSFPNQQYQSQSQSTGQQPTFSAGARYPGENRSQFYSEYDVQNKLQRSYRNQFDNMRYEKNPLSHSEIMYPGDLDGNRWSKRKGAYNSNPFNFNSFDSFPNNDHEVDYNRQKVQIQYVPVPIPVYSVPGTLPGTIPGVVTPGNMVPGYSHISPSSNYNSNYGSFNQGNINDTLLNQSLNPNFLNQRINPKLMQQRIPGSNLLNRNDYNNSSNSLMSHPFKGVGVFPGVASPFDTFYKSYDNHSQITQPFSAPDSIIPGVSMPSMFSSQ